MLVFRSLKKQTDCNLLEISLSVGSTRYGPVDYSGTIYVKDMEGSDYLGVVFGYQSNRKFYVVMWRRENINFAKEDINAGIKGLQLKVRDTFKNLYWRLINLMQELIIRFGTTKKAFSNFRFPLLDLFQGVSKRKSSRSI